MVSKRALIGGWLAALVAASALAAGPASANTAKGTCLIFGEVKARDKEVLILGVRIIGGKGTFTFRDTLLACVGIAKGTPALEDVDVYASGAYNNETCGTGKAWGTVTDVRGSTDPKFEALIEGRKFAVHFFDFTGPFFWHAWSKPTVIDLKDVMESGTKTQEWPTKVKAAKNWQPAGTAHLGVPHQKFALPPVHENACAKAFSVAGIVTIDF